MNRPSVIHYIFETPDSYSSRTLATFDEEEKQIPVDVEERNIAACIVRKLLTILPALVTFS